MFNKFSWNLILHFKTLVPCMSIERYGRRRPVPKGLCKQESYVFGRTI